MHTFVKQMEECPETEYVEKQGSMNKRIIFHKKKKAQAYTNNPVLTHKKQMQQC